MGGGRGTRNRAAPPRHAGSRPGYRRGARSSCRRSGRTRPRRGSPIGVSQGDHRQARHPSRRGARDRPKARVVVGSARGGYRGRGACTVAWRASSQAEDHGSQSAPRYRTRDTPAIGAAQARLSLPRRYAHIRSRPAADTAGYLLSPRKGGGVRGRLLLAWMSRARLIADFERTVLGSEVRANSPPRPRSRSSLGQRRLASGSDLGARLRGVRTGAGSRRARGAARLTQRNRGLISGRDCPPGGLLPAHGGACALSYER